MLAQSRKIACSRTLHGKTASCMRIESFGYPKITMVVKLSVDPDLLQLSSFSAHVLC